MDDLGSVNIGNAVELWKNFLAERMLKMLQLITTLS